MKRIVEHNDKLNENVVLDICSCLLFTVIHLNMKYKKTRFAVEKEEEERADTDWVARAALHTYNYFMSWFCRKYFFDGNMNMTIMSYSYEFEVFVKNKKKMFFPFVISLYFDNHVLHIFNTTKAFCLIHLCISTWEWEIFCMV